MKAMSLSELKALTKVKVLKLMGSKVLNALGCALCALVFAVNTHAAMVYKVSKGDDHIYVGGTIHVLTAADFPLAQPYDSAYAQADELVFETDLAAFRDPAIMAKMGPVLMQSDGQTLTSQLSEKTAKEFTQFLLERQLPIVQFDALSATGAMLTLTMLEFQAQGFVSEGVDAFYHAKGSEQGKDIAWLETVDSQIALLDSFDNGDPDALIAYTLDEIDLSAGIITALHKAWKSGDLAALEAAGLADMKRDFPQIYQDTMLSRNQKWLVQLEAMFDDDNTEYVLVGALHLAGDDGILHMLESKGYAIKRL